jgi:hypothetical protein
MLLAYVSITLLETALAALKKWKGLVKPVLRKFEEY